MGEIIYGGAGGGGGAKNIAAGSNITISSSGASITINGETNSGATTFLAGAMGTNSSGTAGTVNNQMLFAGGNNITLSQSVNANSATLTIIGRAAQTGISSIQGSDTTYTSGKVIFTGAGIVTVQSGAGQSLVFNATVPAVSMGVSTFGNTDGTTGTVSNRIVFVGGSNVTLSQSSAAGGASVTINAVQATGFVNSISVEGNTAGDVTAGTGRLVLAGGNNVTLSGATAAGIMTLTISAGASGGGGGIAASIGGNSTSAGAGYSNVTSGTVVLMGGNNITLSQNGASVTISGANAGGAQTGISSIQASDATYSSGKVIFTGAGAVTVSSGANQSVIINAPAQTLQTSNVHNVTLAGNTSGALADISSGTMTLAGGNGITLSQLGNAVTVMGPTPREAVTIAGNSTSAGAGYTLVSTGTLVLAGGNNITLSQDGHSVTISGANAGGAQTGISGIAGSGASTVTAGTIQFANSNGVSFGLNGSTMTASFSGGAGGGIAASLSGNSTSGGAGYSLVSSGTLYLAGGNNITLSQNGASVTISAPSGGGAGVSSGGNTAGTTGTVDYQLVFVGGSNISLSQSINGSSGTITINGASGGAGGFALNAGGNTTGTTAQITGGTLTLAGGNNITLSQVGSAITISGANAGGAQTGISSIIGSNATYTSGAVVFSGTNNITVASGTGQVILISGPTGGGAGMGSQGNTAGTTGSVGRELYFVGGSNISLSQSVNGGSATLTINGASGGAGAGFSGGMSTNGNTAGTAGTVDRHLVFVGTNNISLSQSINASSATITFNVIVPILSLGVSSSGNTSGQTGTVANALVLVGGNNVTLSQNTDASGATVVISAGASGAAGVQATISGNTSGTLAAISSGTMTLAGGNNITLSQVGNAVTISGPSGGGAGMGNSANTSGTSGSVGKELYFYGGANISLSQSVNGSSGSLWIVGASGGGAGFSGGMSTEGNSAGTAGTVDRQVVFVGGTNVTLSQSVNASSATITIIGADPTNALKSAGISTNGNTAGTTGFASAQIMFVGGSNITLSQSLNNGSVSLTLVGLSAPSSTSYVANVSNVSSVGSLSSRFALADHAHIGLAGVNFSGTASTFVGNLVVSAGNNMTMSTGGNSSAGSIALHNLLSSTSYVANVSNVSSVGSLSSRFALADHAHIGVGGIVVSGTATTFVGNVLLSAGEGITLTTGGNSSAVTIQIKGHNERTVDNWMPSGIGVSSATQMGQSSLIIFPAIAPQPVTASRVDVYVSNSVSTSSNSSYQGTLSLAAVLYTRNVSTLSSVSSGSVSYTWNGTGTTSSGSIVGLRGFSIPLNVNAAAGQYYIGILSQTASANANWVTLQNLMVVPFATAYSGLFGATNASNQFVPGLGVFSAQTAAIPGTVALGDLVGNVAATGRPIVNFINFTA